MRLTDRHLLMSQQMLSKKIRKKLLPLLKLKLKKLLRPLKRSLRVRRKTLR
jgi:hypothetical protein